MKLYSNIINPRECGYKSRGGWGVGNLLLGNLLLLKGEFTNFDNVRLNDALDGISIY